MMYVMCVMYYEVDVGDVQKVGYVMQMKSWIRQFFGKKPWSFREQIDSASNTSWAPRNAACRSFPTRHSAGPPGPRRPTILGCGETATVLLMPFAAVPDCFLVDPWFKLVKGC